MSQKSILNFFTKSPAPTTPKSNKNPSSSENREDSGTPNSKKESNKSSSNNKTPVSKTPKEKSKNGGVKSQPTKTPELKTLNGHQSNGSEKSKPSRKRIILYDSEEEESPSKKKPEGYELDSEDSGDEYVPDDTHESEEEEISEASEGSPSAETEEDSPVKRPTKKRKRGTEVSKPNKKILLNNESKTPNKKLSAFSAPVTPKAKMPSSSTPATPSTTSEQGTTKTDGKNWTHLNYDFLKPEKIRDANKRRPSDPNYNPRTLHVPDDFLVSLTPGMRQWWELKAKNYDVILFFKVGKFYEFYHMDAVIGVKELSLTFMKGDFAHCGFPEISYGRFSANLVDKGYKVARVEQTETPENMAERVQKMHKPTKFDRVVRREICQMTTKGTRIFTVVDGESRESQSQYLLAICEKENDRITSTYGVCFVDTTIGVFNIGQFKDDRHSSRLRTMIAMYPPSQVLFERNRITKRTQQLLDTALSGAVKEALSSESEFWSATDTLKKLRERNYFTDEKTPKELVDFIGDSDSLCLTASEESELGVRSLGAVIWLLTRCLLDYQLISLSQFEIYKPADLQLSRIPDKTQEIINKTMIMDAITLRNLNVLDNGCGGVQGTLLAQIDHCVTPFGKRMLRYWLCNPVTSIHEIKNRQAALQILQANPNLIKEAHDLLKKVPDLERLVSRIHAQSSKGIEDSHPENRAVMFEEKVYSKRKIIDFLSVLNGFQVLHEVADLFRESGVCGDSDVIVQFTHTKDSEPSGKFPNIKSNLNFFEKAFDHEEAKKEGKIVPSHGVDEEYDNALDLIAEVEKDVKAYLKTQCEYFGCKVTFVGVEKKRFQLEVPEGAARKAGSEYELTGQRKGFKKFYTPEAKELLERQISAEAVKNNALRDLRKRIFAHFSGNIDDWNQAIYAIANIDVLMSLAIYGNSIVGDSCYPEFFKPDHWKKPYVKVENGTFPCGSGEFIPNDTEIGGDGASILLLTGPNMGGKSTLMRQLGLFTILAQMGCPVPAARLEMSVVDRIFTRIGAQDDIMAGESTFYLEMCETSAVLAHASRHSLVLIDELGRGTSTYDGTAIAAAVLRELCRMESRTIFSTHYHSLVDSFKEDPNISLVHMACMAENDDEEGSEETVTFLYKVASGGCPKSYGFNAARLAGIPKNITQLGSKRARELESEALQRKFFRLLFTTENPVEVIKSM